MTNVSGNFEIIHVECYSACSFSPPQNTHRIKILNDKNTYSETLIGCHQTVAGNCSDDLGVPLPQISSGSVV